MTSPEEIKLIKEAIESKVGQKIKGFVKIYQTSINGDDEKNFHKNCDNKNHTIFF